MTALDRKITPRRLFYVMRRELADCRLYSFSARKPGGCGKTAYGAAVQAGSEVPPARVSCADAIGAVRVDVASSWEPSRRRASRHTMILFTTGRHPGEHGGALRLRIFGQPARCSKVRSRRGVRTCSAQSAQTGFRRDPRRVIPARSPALRAAPLALTAAVLSTASAFRCPRSDFPSGGGVFRAKRYDGGDPRLFRPAGPARWSFRSCRACCRRLRELRAVVSGVSGVRRFSLFVVQSTYRRTAREPLCFVNRKNAGQFSRFTFRNRMIR